MQRDRDEVDAIARRMAAAAAAGVRARAAADGFALRDAHAKGHACAHATFEVAGDLPDELAHGLFANPGRYRAWIRFSNAAARVRPDRRRDVRGMAIKVMGVDGEAATGGRATTQDFLLIDTPRFFVATARDYEAFERGRLGFLLRHPAALRALACMLRAPRHPLACTYFGVTPYRLGDGAMRFRAVPDGRPAARKLARGEPDALFVALFDALAAGSARFAFEVQRLAVRNGGAVEPLGPYRRVATIDMPAQNVAHGDQVWFGEQLAFSPWTALAAHAPLGEINRVRRRVYAAVSAARHAVDGEPAREPDPSSVDRLHRTERLHPSVHQHTPQNEFAAAAAIAPGHRAAVVDALAAIDAELPKGGPPPAGDVALPLHRLDTLHFARLVVIGDDLVLACNFDGARDAFVDALVAACGDGLDALFRHCEGYPGRERLAEFLRARAVRAEAFYTGTPGRSVHRIRAEADLRRRIDDFLDRGAPPGGWSAVPPEQIRRRIQRFVATRVSKEWLMRPPPAPRNWRPVANAAAGALAIALPALAIAVAGVRGAAAVAAVAVAGLLAYVALRARLLAHDVADDAVRRPVAADADPIEGPVPVQNWLTHVATVKPSRFRMRLLRTVLRVVDLRARYEFNQGHLAGIPSIHFARWMLLPGRRLVFFSNYDGTWDAYLDDFIERAADGLTGVWSNTEDFPRTRPVFRFGATDDRAFKQWTRAHQVDTQVWYSAYPDLTVAEINQNSAIRAGLYGDLRGPALRRWLRRFGRAA